MGVDAAVILQSKWYLFVENNATKKCTYQSMLDSSYVGGNVTKTIDTSHPGIEIVFDKIKSSLVDGSTILVIDRVAIFPTLNLPVVPKINDLIVDPSLREWEVKDIDTDPVDAAWELRIRPIS